MKFILALVACLIISLFANAQSPDRPGYIVRSSGDTVRGYLKDKPLGILVFTVDFKTTASADEYTSYSPTQVKAYQYDGSNAFRAITFTNPNAGTPKAQTCFARLLVSGQCDLYSLQDGNVLYFIVKKDTMVHFLYDDDLHAEPYLRGNFRNELNFFAVGCESNRTGIESMPYTEESLTRYFQKLDACLEPNKATTTFYNRTKAHIGFFAYAGGIVFGDSKSQITGEARLQLAYPQFKQPISFNLGFRYTSVVKKQTDPSYLVAAIYHKNTYTIVSFPFTVQVNLTHGIVQPFLFSGLSALRTSINTDLNPYLLGDNYYQRWGAAFLAGAGVEVSLAKFLQGRLEWRYEDFLQYPTLGVSVRF